MAAGAPPSARWKCPAYTASAGRAMSSGTARLAVGNPSSGPPRPSPRTTGPRTSWGRPSSRAAPPRRPRRGAPGCGSRTPASRPSPVRPTPTTSKPYVAPSRRSSADVAPPAVAEVEVLADHDQPGRELVDEDLFDEVLGRLLGAALVEGNHQGAVDAAVGQQLELLFEPGQLLGRRLGAHHRGRMAVEGDHDGGESGRAAARRQRSRRSARWPRWTPSYAPMVTAVPSGSGHRDRG